MIKVSIVVPAYNEENYITQFLQNLDAQDIDCQTTEVLIADGGSSDETLNKINSFEGKLVLRVLPNPQRIVSTGLNKCIKEAKGEFIIRMDVHTTYAFDYVSKCVAALELNMAECVGGAWSIDEDITARSPVGLAFASRVGSGGAKSRKSAYSGFVDTVYLGAWRRNYLVEIGGFDELMVRNQDDELCLRIRMNGGKIYQDNKIRSTYRPRHSLKKLWKQFFQYGYWRPAVIKKHNAAGSWRQYLPPVLVVYLVFGVTLSFVSSLGIVLLLSYPLALFFALYLEYGTSIPVGRLAHATIAVIAMHVSYGVGFLTYFLVEKKRSNELPEYSR